MVHTHMRQRYSADDDHPKVLEQRLGLSSAGTDGISSKGLVNDTRERQEGLGDGQHCHGVGQTRSYVGLRSTNRPAKTHPQPEQLRTFQPGLKGQHVGGFEVGADVFVHVAHFKEARSSTNRSVAASVDNPAVARSALRALATSSGRRRRAPNTEATAAHKAAARVRSNTPYPMSARTKASLPVWCKRTARPLLLFLVLEGHFISNFPPRTPGLKGHIANAHRVRPPACPVRPARDGQRAGLVSDLERQVSSGYSTD
jgi:hypothetical protein